MAKEATSTSLYLWALVRISLGLIFLWAFFDKLLGLGFATCRDSATGAVATMCDKAWLSGGSPTSGFLKNAVSGPFEPVFRAMSGNLAVDALFMAGLLLIGLALTLGIGMKLATTTGALLMFMMWLAVLPKENHPFLDEHIIYIFALLGLLTSNQNQKWGLRSWWVKQPLVKRIPLLE